MTLNSGSRPSVIQLIVTALVVTIVLSAAGIAAIRSYAEEYFLSAPRDVNAGAAVKFISALRTGNEKSAILYAKSLASEILREAPRGDYMIFTADIGCINSYLTDPFNTTDFLYWQDSLKLKELADKVSVRPPLSAPAAIFKYTGDKLGSVENKIPHPLLNSMISGSSLSGLDGVRLCAALLRQKGYTPYMTSFPGVTWEKIPPFIEVWKDGKCQGTGIVWKGSFSSGRNSRELFKSLLPDEKMPEVKGLQICELPHFRIFNTELGKALEKSAVRNAPVLSFSPADEIECYPAEEKIDFSYWNDSARVFMMLPSCEKYRKKVPAGGKQ